MNSDKNTPRIITKKSSDVKWRIFDSFGGIGFVEFGIIMLFIVIGILQTFYLKHIHAILVLVVWILLMIICVLLIKTNSKGRKNYIVFFNWIKYLFIAKKGDSINNISNIAVVKNNKIYYKNNFVGVVYEIKAQDISMMTQNERDNTIQHLRNLLNVADFDFQITKIEVPFNFQKNKDFLENLADQNYKNDKKMEQISSWYDTLEVIESGDINFQNKYYIIFNLFTQTKEKDLTLNLNQFLSNSHFCLTPTSQQETEYLASKMLLPSKWFNESDKDCKIVQKPKFLKSSNEKYFSLMTINIYPSVVYDGWLSDFSNLPNIDVNIKVQKMSNFEALKKLDAVIKTSEVNTSRHASVEIDNKLYLESFYDLISLIKEGGESLKNVVVTFTVYADSKIELFNRKTELKNLLLQSGFIPNELKNQQLTTYEFIQNSISKSSDFQEMCISTLASSWIFKPQPFSDPKGLFMGTDMYDYPLMLDVQHYDTNRTSYNAIFFGAMGKGKSLNCSKQLNWLYCKGTKVYIIDPENEYTQMCQYYDGDIISFGQPDSIINPLEIYNDNFYEHIINLRTWFMMFYPELNNVTYRNQLEILIRQVYQQFNIDQTNFETIAREKWPTLKDMLAVMEQDNEYDITLRSAIKNLNGVDGSYFNGISTVDLKKDFVVFNINNKNKDQTLFNAWMSLVLAYLDKQIRLNKIKNDSLPNNLKRWTCLAVDEAHMLLNKKNMIAFDYLFTLSKNARKYNASLFIITQNINDLQSDDAELKQKFSGLLNNFQYSFIHTLASEDIRALDEVLHSAGGLNIYEKQFLSSDQRGACLFGYGNNNRQILNIVASETEFLTFKATQKLEGEYYE